ncbi:MAG: hypothetical protein M0P00_03675 [Bacteroidaceae bacterium]|nr:hypothetical protein [Bacteroidaceae bacterium]
MENTKFLYGVAVQGIQSFIFQTNTLKEIVGASELVESICTDAFNEFGKEKEKVILEAAGNIKYEFSSKEECEKAVLEFPKKVMQMAPGITVSQAVVKYDNNDFKKAVNDLEKYLQAQRNKQYRSMTLGMNGMLRSRKTGLPAIKFEKPEAIDAATFAKVNNSKSFKLFKKCFGPSINEKLVTYDIDKITGNNNWIAVVHIDGNGLGRVVEEVGSSSAELRSFSIDLNKSTVAAAQAAYQVISKKYKFDPDNIIPIRPIILGGDDFTVICRADFAVEYVQAYLREFESETARKKHKLTACAGIAFIKSSYPFYYGYNLAESLCNRAKKDAKKFNSKIAPSCLMFHKVQDSFVEDFEFIVKRELTPQEKQSFEFGPYYLKEKQGNWTIDNLLEKIKLFDTKEGNVVKSHLRQWTSLLFHDPGQAEQKEIRVESLLADKDLKKLLQEVTKGYYDNSVDVTKYPVYDMLSLHAVINQKNEEEDKK